MAQLQNKPSVDYAHIPKQRHSISSSSKPKPDPHQVMLETMGNPRTQTFTWERLEEMRIRRLGLTNKYSRHFNVTRTKPEAAYQDNNSSRLELPGSGASTSGDAQSIASGQRNNNNDVMISSGEAEKLRNSIAPFATVSKPTCGYFFTDETSNKKVKFGIPPSNLVKWRNSSAGNN